jgi:allantoinase
VESDLYIDGGHIVSIGKPPERKIPDETVDARDLVVLPGGIDPHVHFDDPGYTWREDFLSGTSMAAAGGITTVIDMPCTSIPPVTNGRNLSEKLSAIEGKAVVDFGLYGGVSAQSFEEGFPGFMQELSDTVLGFKTYFISGMESYGRLDHFRFREVLARARDLDLPVLLHAEDYDFVTAATEQARKAGDDPVHYYRSRPEAAELLAALSAAALARETGARLHIVHVGTAAVSEVLGKNGVTGETGPQYLAFDLKDFERMGSTLKCTPPVKKPGNRERLWKMLADGRLSFVASDHAPCTEQEKGTGSIWTDYAGMPGSGLLLPYIFSEGFMKGRLSLQRMLEVTSGSAAKQYGIDNLKGSIEEGKEADLVLIDPERRWTVHGEAFLSKGHITPFEGIELQGKIMKTILRGSVIYDAKDGITAAPGYGALLRKTS